MTPSSEQMTTKLSLSLKHTEKDGAGCFPVLGIQSAPWAFSTKNCSGRGEQMEEALNLRKHQGSNSLG